MGIRMNIILDNTCLNKICSIEKKNNTWVLYDCDDESIRIPAEDSIFPSSMNMRYRNKRSNDGKVENDSSVVWILVGYTDKENCIYEQVGRNNSLTNMLAEIKEDIKCFYFGKKKYVNLKGKQYTKLVFYEVDIDKYLESDDLFKQLFTEVPKDPSLYLAYRYNKAAYVEGKIGALTKADGNMYHESGLDKYYYGYFKGRIR